MTLLVALAGLAAMVVIHELSHLLAARAMGVRVEEFVLGRGTLLLSARVGGSSVSVRLLPFLGGQVRIAGMFDERGPGSLASQAPWRRALIVAAGPGVNLLLAFALLLCGHLANGGALAAGLGAAGGDAVRVVAGLGGAAAGLVTGDGGGFSRGPSRRSCERSRGRRSRPARPGTTSGWSRSWGLTSGSSTCCPCPRSTAVASPLSPSRRRAGGPWTGTLSAGSSPWG